MLEEAARAARGDGRGRRALRLAAARGRYLRAEPFLPGAPLGDLAVDATLRAAARRGGLPLRRPDLRRKARVRPRRSLVVFAVDASESMAAHDRLRLAQGAALGLLGDAYLRRDRVAVVVFEGTTARVLLEPTSSVDRARAHLRRLCLGGATPLVAGLACAWRLVCAERTRDPDLAATLVLLTDGRANVALDPGVDPRAEALALATRLRLDGVDALVVDAGQWGPERPELGALARALGARRLRVGAGGVARLVAAVREG